MTKLDLTITLKAIRNAYPCTRGWKKLLAGLGYADGKYDPDRVVSLGDIALINDAADALWCVRALDWDNVDVRRAVISGAVLPAVKRASKHTKDARVHDAIGAIARWCGGDDTADLRQVSAAAYAAAEDATTVAAYAAAATYASAAAAAYSATTATYASAAAAAYSATTATYASAAAAADAVETRKTEREHQRQDIIAAFPPVAVNR